MPSLSFDKAKGAKAIAKVKDGDYDGEVLYINADDTSTSRKPKREINAMAYDKELKALRPAQRTALMNRLQEAMSKGIPPEHLVGESEEVKHLYSRIQSEQSKDTSVVLPDDCSFQLLPPSDPNTRSVWYIAGASGSGKSYIARQLAEAYKKMFPKREIYLISKLNEDSTLDTMKVGKPKRIKVQSLVDDYPTIEEFRDCMVIFDDYDTFQGAEAKAVQQLINDLAIQARHTNTSMLCLTHYITNYKATRLLLNEAQYFVVYPQATSYHALSYLLKTHIGMDADEIKNLRKLGRWVCVSKNFPQYLISQHTAKVLHQD
jgi:hypothetical protein